MSYRLDEQTKLHFLLLCQAYGKSTMLEEARNTKSLRVLYEQVNPKDISNGITDIKKMVERFMQFFRPYKSSLKLKGEVKKFIDGLPDPAEVEKTLFSADEEEIKRVGKEVTTKTDNVVRAMDSVRSGIIKVAEALQDTIEKNPGMEEVEIGQLFEDPEWEDKIPMKKDKFVAGIRKAFVPSAQYQSSIQKGMKAAQQSTAGDGKSGLGKLFSTIAKFFVGMSQKKASVDAFPKVYEAFVEFLNGVTFTQLTQISKLMKSEGGKLIITAATESGETGAAAAAAAGGAEVKNEKEAAASKKVKSDDLEKELGADEKSKAYIAALRGNDSTKDLLESRIYKKSLLSLMFEAVTYDDLLKIAKGVKDVDEKDAQRLASKAAKFLKSKGADVDDSEAPNIEEEGGAEDADAAAIQAQKAASDVKTQAKALSIGQLVRKNIMDTIQPFLDRKSLSKKDRDALVKSAAEMEESLKSTAKELADFSADEMAGVLDKWFNGLDPKLQSKLGGSVGSKKVMQGIAKSIKGNIQGNFQIESSFARSKEDLIVEHWQRLAGIK